MSNIKNIIKNQALRRALAEKSHKHFFSIYFSHYIKYPMANFHDDMFKITNDHNLQYASIMAFRGSAKSTIMTMSYPIWSIIGEPQKKFVILVGQTQRQARQHLQNIKSELEVNTLLKADLGPYKQTDDEWGSQSLVIPKHGARITAVSMEQTIRGMRHLQHRPDLIICDDIEDITSVKTEEGRDKSYNWITSEVIPAGDHGTKVIFVGNLLHEDSTMVRLKKNLIKKCKGKSLFVPIVDEDENITWPGKYPDMDAIREQEIKVGNHISWAREYCLKIVPDEDQIVKQDWIQYYKNLPIDDNKKISAIITGVDLAISQKSTADYTAMVSIAVFKGKPYPEIYILPNISNKRMTFNTILNKTKERHLHLKDVYSISDVLMENNAFQEAAIQALNRIGVPAKGVTSTVDKRARLSAVSHLFENGKVFFPERNADLLVKQVLGLGSEKHDDLVDALTMCLQRAVEKKYNQIGMAVADINHAIRYDENFEKNKADYEKKKKEDHYRLMQKLLDKGVLPA